jgi:hypothetical protein
MTTPRRWTLRVIAAGAVLEACSSSYVTTRDGGAGGMDTGVDEGTPDAGDDGTDGASACVPVAVQPPPQHGGAACPSDASACFPGDVTSFTPQWRPPIAAAPHANMCTAEQISDAYTLCLSTATSATPCSSWIAANGACWGCLSTSPTASRFGAGIDVGPIFLVNTPGCIALAEPCNQPCAAAFQAHILCDSLVACDPTMGACLVTASSSSAYEACSAAADTCGCSGFTTSAGCFQLLLDDPANHPSVSICGLEGGFPQRYSGIATFMCGP